MIPSCKLILFMASVFHFLILVLALFTNPSLSLSISAPNPSNPFIPSNPMPTKRNLSTFLSDSQEPFQYPPPMAKKLRRLPHVFGRVLELPLNSEADVSVEERADCFRFSADFDCLSGGDVKAVVVEVHPGITKVLVRGGGLLIDDWEIDVWRFRLPATTRLEAAMVVCRAGKLVVTVPKVGGGEKRRTGGGSRHGRSNMGDPLAVV